MAVKVYYGICNTDPSVEAKEVVMRDPEITEEFEFSRGDLLVVYFAQGNTNAAPTLTVKNADSSSEVSISIDTGKQVKTQDQRFPSPYVWDDGETVIFAYTVHPNTIGNITQNTYYWELVDAAPASKEVYGITRLDEYGDEDPASAIAWLDHEQANDIAITPELVRWLFRALLDGETYEDQEGEKELGLKWTPAESGTLDDLGTLSLITRGREVVIQYPLSAKIQNIVENEVNSRLADYATIGVYEDADGNKFTKTKVPGFTSQLVNDGEGNTITIDGTTIPLKFITNWLAEDLHIQGPPSTGIPKITGPGLVISGENSAVQIEPNLAVSGTVVAGGAMSEYNTPLTERYSPLLRTVNYTSVTEEIGANYSNNHHKINIDLDGWTPIGIIGWNTNYAGSNSGDSTYCFLWECFITNPTNDDPSRYVQYSIRNIINRRVYVTVVFTVLYVKNLSTITTTQPAVENNEGE